MTCFEGTARDVVLGGALGSKMRALPSLPAKTSSSAVSSSAFRGTYRPEGALGLQLLGFKRLAGGCPKSACLTKDCLVGGTDCADRGGAWVWVNWYEMRCSVALSSARVASSQSSKANSSSSLMAEFEVMGLCERLLLRALLRTSKVLNKAVCNQQQEVGPSVILREWAPIVYFKNIYCFLRLTRIRQPTVNAVSNSSHLIYHSTLLGGLAYASGNITSPDSFNSLVGGAGIPELTSPRSRLVSAH